MELNIHQYAIKVIKWAGFQGKRLITRKYYGEPLEENEKELTIKYRNKLITLDKDCVLIDYEIRTEISASEEQ